MSRHRVTLVVAIQEVCVERSMRCEMTGPFATHVHPNYFMLHRHVH